MLVMDDLSNNYDKILTMQSLHRAFTTLELRKKLRGKKYPLDIVDSLIANLKDRQVSNLLLSTFLLSLFLFINNQEVV